MAVHPRPAALAQRMSAAPAGRHGRMRDGEYGAAGPQVPPSRTWWAPAAPAASSQQQQPAAQAWGTRAREVRGERGAGARPGGSRRATVPLWKAARLPRSHGVGAVVLAAARGRAAAAARALGRWLWVGDALLCGRGGRAAAEPPARVPGARGRTPWRRCGPRRVPKAAWIQGPDARSTIAVESMHHRKTCAKEGVFKSPETGQ